MSDIPLFRLADGRTTDLSGRAATIEKHLQWMIEAQMPTFLGVSFLASEVTPRIDSLRKLAWRHLAKMTI